MPARWVRASSSSIFHPSTFPSNLARRSASEPDSEANPDSTTLRITPGPGVGDPELDERRLRLRVGCVGEPPEGRVARFVEFHGAEDEGAVNRVVHRRQVAVPVDAMFGDRVVVDVPAGFADELPHALDGRLDGDLPLDPIEFVIDCGCRRFVCRSGIGPTHDASCVISNDATPPWLHHDPQLATPPGLQ